MRLATDTKLYASDPTPPQGYDIRTISRLDGSYARFIAAFKKAERHRYKSWGKTYDCVRVYWDDRGNRTDLSYFVKNFITKGRGYDSTGNGYYVFYDKESKAACDAIVWWCNTFRNCYEWFKNLETWSPYTNGEKRYQSWSDVKRGICVYIPYDANKKRTQKDIEQEDRLNDMVDGQIESGLDELEKGGSDKNAADSAKSDNRNWLYIAAGILGFAVILKLIKKRKGKA